MSFWALLLAAGLCRADVGRGEALLARTVSEALPVIVRVDGFGLAEEARQLGRWLPVRGEPVLVDQGGVWSVRAAGGTFPVSARLAQTLRRANRFVAVEDEAKARPVPVEEIKGALLSPAGVASVRGLFDRAMAGAIRIGGKPKILEWGGEAVLDGEVRFYALGDPLREILGLVLERRRDPEGLERLYRERGREMRELDRYNGLRAFLDRPRVWDERRLDFLEQAVEELAKSAADTYTMEAKAELEFTLGQDWPGRYLGHWHIHPPDAGTDGWLEGGPPSPPDLERAVEKKDGRELVISFTADGFDVYDLLVRSGQPGPGFGDDPAFSYRSAQWRAHFQAAFERLR